MSRTSSGVICLRFFSRSVGWIMLSPLVTLLLRRSMGLFLSFHPVQVIEVHFVVGHSGCPPDDVEIYTEQHRREPRHSLTRGVVFRKYFNCLFCVASSTSREPHRSADRIVAIYRPFCRRWSP